MMPIYTLSRADVYEDLDQYDKAINDMSRAIKLYPENMLCFSYSIRGRLYMKKGESKKAKSDFQKSCRLGNGEPFKFADESCNKLAEIEKNEARGEKWKYIFSSSSGESYYFDKTSVKPFNKHLRAWFRLEHDVNVILEKRKKENLPVAGYEDYSHSLSFDEYDCSNEQIGVVSVIEYSKNGNVLNSYTKAAINMEPVVPDSMGAAMLKIVCEQKKKATKH
jgi:tetratricopeptide (TPR) repeat protein